MTTQSIQTVRTTILRATVLLLGLPLGLHHVAAQDAPRLVFNSNQPRDVAFSFDSSRLYSSGQEKFVHTWEVRKQGRIGPRYSIAEVTALRWDLARGPRGMVYTMAASPTRPQLAIAGYGARTPNGDIAIFDTATGQIVHLLPQARSQPEEAATGHRQNVFSLAFSQDGRKLASISLDGETRIWTETGGQWTTRVVVPQATQIQAIVKVAFLNQDDPNHDVAVSVRAGDSARVRLIDSRGRTNSVDLPQVHERYVTAIAQDPRSATWASADANGNIYIWRGGGTQNPDTFKLRNGAIAVDLAFGPQSRLFIATKGDPLAGLPASFEMWDIKTKQLLDETVTSMFRVNFACAVSPDQQYAVTCGDDEHALLVFPLTTGDGRTVLNKPFQRTRIPTKDPGRSVGKVAFEAKSGSYRLGFGSIRRATRDDFNNYGDIVQAFDFQQSSLITEPDENTVWRTPDDNARGSWRLSPTDKSGRHFNLLFQGQTACKIDMDEIMRGEGSVTSYCWLAGPQMTYAIAVGTNLQNGVYVFQLTNNQRVCPLMRYFRDHTGPVNSISVSHDGKYLASGSSDQTMKIWSLEGIRSWDEVLATRQRFRKASAWGAVFEQRNNAVVISSLIPGGIAANRGLRQGDQVLGIFGNPANTPAQIIRVLGETNDWTQHHLRIRRAGERDDFWSRAIVPAWEPVMTLFVDKDERWALATPQGPYDASPDGDELFGWHINGSRDATPEFHRSDFLRERFEKPDVMKRLLVLGDLRRALQDALPRGKFEEIDRQIREGTFVANATKGAPLIKIVSPVDGKLHENPDGQQNLLIDAEVFFSDERISESYSLSAYVNGVPATRIAAPQPRQVGGRWRYQFQWQVSTDAIHEYNSAVVLAEGIPDKSLVDGAASSVTFCSTQSGVPARLHVLALTADKDYPQGLRLTKSTTDATDLRNALRKHGTEIGDPALFLSGSKPIHLKNLEITAKSVEQAIAKLKADIEANENHAADLLVVFISGHGIAVDNDFYFVPPNQALKDFVRITEDAIKNDGPKKAILRKIGVGWDSLAGLATVKCRKWVILDTCFSGAAANEHEKAKLRRLTREQMLVMSTTNVGQIANEGVAVQQMVKGISGEADGQGETVFSASGRVQQEQHERDGVVDFGEFFNFVLARTDDRTKRIGADRRQTPKISPREGLQNFFAVPIAKYVDQIAGG